MRLRFDKAYLQTVVLTEDQFRSENLLKREENRILNFRSDQTTLHVEQIELIIRAVFPE